MPNHWPQYVNRDKSCTNQADPVNLIFMGRGLGQVLSDLQQRGWGSSFGGTMYLQVQGTGCLPQNAQRFLGSPRYRFHVRLWEDQNNQEILGSAHHESLFTLGVNPPHGGLHNPSAFESGKWKVADDLKAQGYTVDYDYIDLNNFSYVPFANGYAHRLS